jgi:hypothetical protein
MLGTVLKDLVALAILGGAVNGNISPSMFVRPVVDAIVEASRGVALNGRPAERLLAGGMGGTRVTNAVRRL